MKSAFSALLLAASLTGCATSWVVDSDVKSFASPGAIAPGATYRFDRLPSQQADGARQESLEAMAGALAATTADATEGMSSFRDKRAANFEGK